ncbi:MAG: exonuclease domain-containing protein [Acidobacteriaceae bacterium]
MSEQRLLPFIAIDVETANLNNANICQFGAAFFIEGKLADTISFLIDPESSFNPRFRAIHGITHANVRGAPTWDKAYPLLDHLWSNGNGADKIVVSHTYFDREAIAKACAKYMLEPPQPFVWLDTCAIARATWPEMPNHKLPSLASCFDIGYKAHDAAEDARCCGEILVRAAKARGCGIEVFIEEQLTRDRREKVSLSVTFRDDADSPAEAESAEEGPLTSPPRHIDINLNPQNDSMRVGVILFCVFVAIIGLVSFLLRSR